MHWLGYCRFKRGKIQPDSWVSWSSSESRAADSRGTLSSSREHWCKRAGDGEIWATGKRRKRPRQMHCLQARLHTRTTRPEDRDHTHQVLYCILTLRPGHGYFQPPPLSNTSLSRRVGRRESKRDIADQLRFGRLSRGPPVPSMIDPTLHQCAVSMSAADRVLDKACTL